MERPKDKSHAEGTVKFASTWILAALRNEHFFTLREAKEAVKIKLEELNLRDFTAKDGCRRSAYLEEEQAFMRPLPNQRYEAAVWNPNIKVGADYLVSDGRNKYSVPFDLIGVKVDIRLTSQTVEVFFHGNRVASHIRQAVAQRDPIVKRVQPRRWGASSTNLLERRWKNGEKRRRAKKIKGWKMAG